MATFVIVGAGLAGLSAAARLRDAGFDGRVVMVGEEAAHPYDRPPLSKGYLDGSVSSEDLALRPPTWYAENAVEALLGVRAIRLQPSQKTVSLSDGRALRYDKLLIATGGHPRRLRLQGGELDGVMYLRTLSDAGRIRDTLQPGFKLCIVGAGFIGLEVAAMARSRGVDVTIVEALDAPLEGVLGSDMADFCAGVHRDAGVSFRTGTAVVAFEGRERITGLRTSADRVIACDAAILGIGLRPSLEWLEGSGLQMRDGVLTDPYCETTVREIYAAGDAARHQHALFGSLRVEHWQNARLQGAAAADNMLGAGEPYVEVPWFWSDQYQENLQHVGVATRWDDLVIRGNVAERRFTAFYLKDARVSAAFGVNAGRDVRRAAKLIEARCAVEVAELADEAVDLRDLVSVQGAVP
jgi:3-phenylpropionate/trans-cinnamate dioxygenase ferredoxin reductase subunit